jgi:AraC-like DNA-binding protein
LGQSKQQAIEILIWLITGHLFGMYNPNQLADALGIEKSGLYVHLSDWSLHQWRRLLLEVGCHQALELIQQTATMSAVAQSRRRITLSVDDTVQQRNGKLIAYCYHSGGVVAKES